MNLCSSGHDEVCYDGRTCPVCEAIGERDDARRDAAELQRKLDVSDDIASDLRVQLQELRDSMVAPT